MKIGTVLARSNNVSVVVTGRKGKNILITSVIRCSKGKG